MFHPAGVLAVADERFQFIAKNRQRLIRPLVVNAGDALINEFAGRRVDVVDFAVLHESLE